MELTIPRKLQQSALGNGLAKIPGSLRQRLLIRFDLTKPGTTDITRSAWAAKVRDLAAKTDSLK